MKGNIRCKSVTKLFSRAAIERSVALTKNLKVWDSRFRHFHFEFQLVFYDNTDFPRFIALTHVLTVSFRIKSRNENCTCKGTLLAKVASEIKSNILVQTQLSHSYQL